MADDNTYAQAQQQPPKPNPALRSLDRLVGTWDVSGPDIDGQVIFEWMEGGFFLMQHVNLVHGGHRIKGIEIIGYGRDWTGASSQDCTSHYFGNEGEVFTYIWDVGENTLTIWGGERGSPANFKGKFSDDGNTVTGGWEWPGGGYESTMTRVASE